MPPFMRSSFAVMLGFMVMMVTVIALTLVMVKTTGQQSGHPTPGYLLINAIYSLIAAGVGGFVTASIAGRKPIQHAAVLGAIVLALGLYSYRHYTGLQPLWYQGMLVILPPLCILGGAALQARRTGA